LCKHYLHLPFHLRGSCLSHDLSLQRACSPESSFTLDLKATANRHCRLFSSRHSSYTSHPSSALPRGPLSIANSLLLALLPQHGHVCGESVVLHRCFQLSHLPPSVPPASSLTPNESLLLLLCPSTVYRSRLIHLYYTCVAVSKPFQGALPRLGWRAPSTGLVRHGCACSSTRQLLSFLLLQ
jgi:hypothetical protein